MPYYTRDPKRDHNFDNHPNDGFSLHGLQLQVWGWAEAISLVLGGSRVPEWAYGLGMCGLSIGWYAGIRLGKQRVGGRCIGFRV